MPVDVEKFTTHLRKHAKQRSQRICATRVREALQAGGANTVGHLIDAKTYGPVMLRNGFHKITVEKPEGYVFMKGDVVVIEPYEGGNPSGHIAGFDGKNWLSDFVQTGFWPGPGYRTHRPSYVVYRP